ncbi:YraN family protein [Thioclava sp. FR2]|uniref:YraN family protein n=1 Tax=Thioclava sp. FR2 TaxID=3445780 RepID=UPI003EBD66A5
MSGLRSYHAGRVAEDLVARTYSDCGHLVCARRWRGRSGEIDLIARQGDMVVFVEVKHSATHAQAAESLSRGQMQRICRSAMEFLAGEPKGQDTECRFDLALVDGAGRIEILHNAFAA